MNSKRSGFAIVYGLLILLFITVTGTAILVMTRSDRESAARYQNSQVAFQAAQIALKAVEGQLANAPDTVVALLRKFLVTSDHKWLLGAKVSDAKKINLINLGTDSKYSAKIIGFDSVNSLLTIEAMGYDNLGSKKRVTAMYKLSGLSVPSLKAVRPYGLFLGGALSNCSAPINIIGDVYLNMGGSVALQYFNKGGTINGNFKTGTSNAFGLNSGGALTVIGNAFIRCAMQPQDILTVNGKAGFENKTISNMNPGSGKFVLKGNSFFNETSTFGYAGCVVGAASKYVRYNSGIGADRFTGFLTKNPVASQMSLADSLGMVPGDEACDTVKLPTTWDVMYVSGTITATNVESWWGSQQSAGKLYQGEWLVLRLNGSVTMNGGSFTKKVIWITDNNCISVNGTWYDCSDESNTFIHVNGTGCMYGMGVPNNKSFRGYIFVTTTNANGVSYQFGTGTVFKGAIEQTAGIFNLNSGTLNLDFSPGSSGQEAVQEIVDLGLVVAAN
jgi:hypothetical protein